MDGVRKIAKGVYEINFRLGKGMKRYQRRVRALSFREAYNIKIKLMDEYLSSFQSNNHNKLNADFNVLRNQLIRDMESDSLAYKTRNRSRSTFDLFFLTFLPSRYPIIKRLTDLRLECLYEYKNYVTMDLKRIAGWRSELGTLKAIIRRLARLGYCEKGITEFLEDIKRPEYSSKSFTPISKEDKIALLDFVKVDRPCYFGVTYFLMRLGWRIEETLSIKRYNIEMEGKEPISIKLEAAIRKNKKDFVLESIDADLAKVIKVFLADGSETQWLFYNSKRNKIKADHYRNYLVRISQEIIDRRITPHDFRRSLVTEAARDGLALKDVMGITGHTDINVLLKHYSFSTEVGRKKVLASTRI